MDPLTFGSTGEFVVQVVVRIESVVVVGVDVVDVGGVAVAAVAAVAACDDSDDGPAEPSPPTNRFGRKPRDAMFRTT